MSAKPISRRRFIGITAAASGALLLPWPAARLDKLVWRGEAMGAEAAITLFHPAHADGRAWAETLVADCVGEIGRIERLFSLFDPESTLCRLNRDGVVRDAPADFRHLIAVAVRLSALSGGAFDATVQPLWRLFADHFRAPDPDPAGPSREAIETAAHHVGWRGLRMEGRDVALTRPGMAVTLNGLAQGFATDRVRDLLVTRGVTRTLVNLGEFGAIGRPPGESPWRIGVADPADPHRTLEILPLDDGMAVASSGGYGTRFDRAGRFHHLLDTASGEPARGWAGVTVVAEGATLADGLSTAVATAPMERAETILRGGAARSAVLVAPDGSMRRFVG